MKFERFATHVHHSLVAIALLSICPLPAMAQTDHSHTLPMQGNSTADQQSQASALLRIVREATEKFKDVSEAEKEGYALTFGCVSGPDQGAMGLHYVNSYLLDKGEVNPRKPQIVIYEPTPNGKPKLIGADYLVFADAWDAQHPNEPPELMGQLFHFFETPNRFALPAFYTLHVWAWKENPNGAFVNWHPDVSCQSFVGQTTQ
ncbi:MAG TPA: hypothetical protein VH437_04905 [Terriglobales bacterium]|jgi:hypothetical protein